MSDRLQALLVLGEELEAADERALQAALETDPTLRDELLADLRIDGLLRAAALEAAEDAAFVDQFEARLEAEADGAAFVAGVEARLRDAAPKRSRPIVRRRSGALVPALLAAGLLIAGGLALQLLRTPERPTETARRTPTAAPTLRPTTPAIPTRSTPIPDRSPSPAVSSPAPSPTPTTRTPSPSPSPRPTPTVPSPRPSPTPTATGATPSPAPTTQAAPPKPLEVQVAGRISTRVGKRWRAATGAALPWRTADVVRAEGAVRLTFPDGARVELSKGAVVALATRAPVALDLQRGAVYCRVPRRPAQRPGLRFSVRTPDGEARVTGTEFGVKRSGGRTTVAVDAGEVVCANAHGKARVRAGYGVRFRAARAPGRARPMDAARIFGWRMRLRPRERIVFRSDFERGLPGSWDEGKVVAGPPRGRNRRCLETLDKPDGATIHMSIPAEQQVRQGERVLRFRVFARGPKIAVQFKNEDYGDNCKHFLTGVPVGRWERFEIPLSEFRILKSRGGPNAGKGVRPGHRLTYLQLRVLEGDGPSYVDDIELIERLPR